MVLPHEDSLYSAIAVFQETNRISNVFVASKRKRIPINIFQHALIMKIKAYLSSILGEPIFAIYKNSFVSMVWCFFGISILETYQ